MEQSRIALADVAFKSSTASTYNKDFGKGKSELRAEGFPIEKTKHFIDSYITEKSLAKIKKNIDDETILVSMPVKQANKQENIIPRLYAQELSKRTGNQTIDLSDFLKVRQQESARSSYGSLERSSNHFNIGFKDNEREAELKSKLHGKSILLIDDVLTTGETAVTMATYLKMEIKELDVKGANALVAVDNRKPTQRDLERVAEKLSAQLAPTINQEQMRLDVQAAIAPFTRKKLMRFEISIKSPEGAEQQYSNMVNDISKIQESLKESFASNLFRYPLDKIEMAVLHSSKAENLNNTFALRALLQHYPEATFTKDRAGLVRLYTDTSKTEQLSTSKTGNTNEAAAITEAIKVIQNNARDISQNRTKDNGLSY